jgi:hypothetical protein
MKKGSTIFLKFVLCLMALVVAAVLIRFPLTEGRAQNLDLLHVYLDAVILYMYVGTIPFFIALWQSFKLLGFIEQNNVFSQGAVNALKVIKYCGIAIAALLVVGLVTLKFTHDPNEDAAGPLALGFVTAFISIVVGTGAAVFQRLLQRAVDIKKENDLTV